MPQEYYPLTRILLFGMLNLSFYLAMAYCGQSTGGQSFLDFLQSDLFDYKEAGKFTAMLVALSFFVFKALNKFADGLSTTTKTVIAALTGPALIIILFFLFKK